MDTPAVGSAWANTLANGTRASDTHCFDRSSNNDGRWVHSFGGAPYPALGLLTGPEAVRGRTEGCLCS